LENLKRRDHSEDKGEDGKMVIGWILGKYGDKVQTEMTYRGSLNTVMNPHILLKAGSLTS
jgi:hypothetical protein